MKAIIFLEQHERFEAIETYRDRLTPEQIDMILEAPDGDLIEIRFGVGAAGTQVSIIEEG